MPDAVQLYLVRHAVAHERGDQWPDDRKRPLTDEGRQRMVRQARGIAGLGVTFDAILTSPLTRTRQTAEILAESYRASPRIVDVPALEPGRTPKDVASALKNFTRRTALALVGHEPGLGELASWLLGLRGPLAFKKGSIALIEVALLPPPAGSGELRWFLPPRVMRKLDKGE
jgi:phosphohistidine phosphatase